MVLRQTLMIVNRVAGHAAAYPQRACLTRAVKARKLGRDSARGTVLALTSFSVQPTVIGSE